MLAKAESTVGMWRRSASVFQPAFYLRHAEMPEQQEIGENLKFSDNTKFRFVKVSEIHLFLTKIYVTRFLILVC